jgi:CDP-4-dehydro-6-deoxyglucose reductase
MNRARLIDFWEAAPETRHFVFEADGPVDFLPGQFVSVVAELEGKHITRAYSIAAPPNGARFDLCLNRVDGGIISPYLFSLAPGGEIEWKGPFGVFVWRKPVSDSILVATGTGITPYRSMLLERLPLEPDRHFTLVFGARHEEGLIYRAEFEDLAGRYPNFRFLPTLTRPTGSWAGRTGRVQSHVFEVLGERRDVDVYICGMAAMIDDLRNSLKEKGLDRKKIIVEKYD